ncbi:MAG: ATP-binding protein [candidate division KSB1 bacterium]|nr:ATP-binding protein [candidate division KSB1 bacterium]MDZ7275863.1 ATP-binding protein [candidate division KSB1 bacterium]MDZ7287613.1 ATP-binding protein [candidate division KSB1 bacterium]MDZ7350591.1 ATP-binding protein [candidate division KSB1 bacterium]MDZ7354963.1 ATP-binding protein [candidate division KSB1 bacterium]
MQVPPIPIRHRLFTRLLISHIFLVTIPLLITGQILIHTAQQAIRETILDRNLQFARRSSSLISATLGRAHDILRINAQSPAFSGNDRMGQELIINKIVREFPIFKKISLLDTLGRVIRSTAFGVPRGHSVDPDLLTAIRNNKSHTSPVYISDEKLPLMDIAEPVLVFDEVSACLLAEVDLKEIWALVDSNRVGPRSEAFIFRSDGQYIAHTDRRQVLERQRFEEAAIVAAAIAGKSGSHTYVDRHGVEMLAAYAPIAGQRWATVIQQPTREAFAPSRVMEMQIFLLMAGSALVAALIAAVYTRQIVKPVNELINGITEISRGGLKHQIRRLGRDEISTLALHFNAMTRRLRRFQDRLKRAERLETLNKLSSVLSHEIRNPLNAMVINLQLMRREFHRPEIDPQKLEHYHQILAAEIRRVDDLVSNFLMIARPPKLEKSEQCLNDLLDELVKMETPAALQRGVRVERDYRVSNLRVQLDPNRMHQVFLNIFINAVQAMPGGGRLIIGLDLVNRRSLEDTRRPYAVVWFRDTGKGIPRENLNRIFDFYFSTKKRGTGIGLALALQIVEEHGGTIRVESEVGRGSNFIIYLPA